MAFSQNSPSYSRCGNHIPSEVMNRRVQTRPGFKAPAVAISLIDAQFCALY